MPETPDVNPAAFPTLDDAQIARVAPFGAELRAQAGEILFDQGDADRGVFVVLSGSIEIIGVSNADESSPQSPQPREFYWRSESAFGSARLGPVPGARSQHIARNRPREPPAHDANRRRAR